jgi:transketolase
VRAFDEAASTKGKPTCILSKTFKGKDFPEIEDQMNWHGKALGDKAEGVIKHLRSLIKVNNVKIWPNSRLFNGCSVALRVVS